MSGRPHNEYLRRFATFCASYMNREYGAQMTSAALLYMWEEDRSRRASHKAMDEATLQLAEEQAEEHVRLERDDAQAKEADRNEGLRWIEEVDPDSHY